MNDLQAKVGDLLNDVRNLYAMMQGNRFKMLCSTAVKSGPEYVKCVESIIDDCLSANKQVRKDGYRELKQSISRVVYSEVNIRELRDEAAAIGLRNYSRLNRVELIQQLEQYAGNKSIPSDSNGFERDSTKHASSRDASERDCLPSK